MKSDTSSPVLVARIVKPHGILGEVVLESLTDVEGRLENTAAFLLVRDGKIIKKISVETRRFIMGRAVMKFEGVSGRTEAEMLRNMELAVPEDQIGKLREGQYFVFQLREMEVTTRDGRTYGKVKDVVHAPGGDLLELDSGELIPFTDEICPEVDLENKRITIQPPEGLIKKAQ